MVKNRIGTSDLWVTRPTTLPQVSGVPLFILLVLLTKKGKKAEIFLEIPSLPRIGLYRMKQGSDPDLIH